MSVLIALLMGLIQGITEFLPLSRSAHFSLFENLFKIDYSREGNLLFSSFLYLAALVTIIVTYFSEIRRMIADTADFLKRRFDGEEDGPFLKPAARFTMLIFFASAPMLLVPLFLDSFQKLFSKTGFVGFALLIMGAILFVSDKIVAKGAKTEKTMTVIDAVVVGFAQAISWLPGLSRTGMVIAAGLSRGLDKDFAVKFSLLVSIPSLFCATVGTFLSALQDGVDLSLIPSYLAGFVVAALIGVIAVAVLHRVVIKNKLYILSYYCFAVAVLILVLSIFA